MTKQELNDLKELANEIDELIRKADELEMRIRNLYGDEKDVSGWDTHIQLSYAGTAMKDAVPCMKDALLKLQKAYKVEKDIMDFYDGITKKTRQ